MNGTQAEHLGTLRSGQALMRFAVEVEPCAEDRPQWIHILPLGPHVEARDGRKFTVRDAQEVVRATELPMLIDWEHASEHGDTRAAGWIEELKVEPAEAGTKAGVWGRAHWTPQGREHVTTKHFRFLSPVVVGKRDLKPEGFQFHVDKLTSVALTNRPALRMHGIEAFREQLSQRLGPIDSQEQDMNDQTRRAICQAFGLQPDASDDQLVAAAKPLLEAAQTAQSLKAACDTLTHQLNDARADTAKLAQQLNAYQATSFKSEVQSFLAEGSRAGKIPPSARKRWAEFCLASPENFATFKDTIYPGLATIGAPAPAPGKQTERRSRLRANVNGVDRAALKRLGFTDEQIAESEGEVFDPKKRPAATEPEDADDDDDLDDDEDAEGDDNEEDEQPAAGAPPAQPQTGG